MAKLSIKELTSRSMSVMILAGCLDRLTTILTTSYDDFIEGSQSQFQDLDSRMGKGSSLMRGLEGKGDYSERGKRKNTK